MRAGMAGGRTDRHKPDKSHAAASIPAAIGVETGSRCFAFAIKYLARSDLTDL